MAARFSIREDGLGEVATGRLYYAGDTASATLPTGTTKPDVMLVEGGPTATVTIVEGAIETGDGQAAGVETA